MSLQYVHVQTGGCILCDLTSHSYREINACTSLHLERMPYTFVASPASGNISLIHKHHLNVAIAAHACMYRRFRVGCPHRARVADKIIVLLEIIKIFYKNCKDVGMA